MDEKTRAAAIAAFEDSIKSVGAQSLEDGMNTVRRVFAKLSELIERIDSREKLDSWLASLPPQCPSDDELFIAAMSQLPAVMASLIDKVGAEVNQEFGANAKRGRPRRLTQKLEASVCDYISELHRKGTPLQIAKQRSAAKFKVSKGTVVRAWSTRGRSRPPQLKEIIEYVEV